MRTPDPYLNPAPRTRAFSRWRGGANLFSGVENFLLYDFYSTDGRVKREMCLPTRIATTMSARWSSTQNAYGRLAARSGLSAAYSTRTGQGDDRVLIQRTLGEGLALPNDGSQYCIFRDSINGLEYIRNCAELCNQGLYMELNAYEYHAFVDFRIVADSAVRPYSYLASYLGGRGVAKHKRGACKNCLSSRYVSRSRIW